MVEPTGLYSYTPKGDAAFLNIVEVAARLHLIHVHRKIRSGHLLFQDSS